MGDEGRDRLETKHLFLLLWLRVVTIRAPSNLRLLKAFCLPGQNYPRLGLRVSLESTGTNERVLASVHVFLLLVGRQEIYRF